MSHLFVRPHQLPLVFMMARPQGQEGFLLLHADEDKATAHRLRQPQPVVEEIEPSATIKRYPSLGVAEESKVCVSSRKSAPLCRSLIDCRPTKMLVS